MLTEVLSWPPFKPALFHSLECIYGIRIPFLYKASGILCSSVRALTGTRVDPHI